MEMGKFGFLGKSISLPRSSIRSTFVRCARERGLPEPRHSHKIFLEKFTQSHGPLSPQVLSDQQPFSKVALLPADGPVSDAVRELGVSAGFTADSLVPGAFPDRRPGLSRNPRNAIPFAKCPEGRPRVHSYSIRSATPWQNGYYFYAVAAAAAALSLFLVVVVVVAVVRLNFSAPRDEVLSTF